MNITENNMSYRKIIIKIIGAKNSKIQSLGRYSLAMNNTFTIVDRAKINVYNRMKCHAPLLVLCSCKALSIQLF